MSQRRALKFKPGTADIEEEATGASLTDMLGSLADVKMPKDAEEPILAAPVRTAMFDWLIEIRATKELESVKVTPRRTALLAGPPGCGKTTLAHHIAARLGHPLVVMEAAAVHERWLGATGENLLKFFQTMQLWPDPVVVLLDEIDALGAKRSEGHGSSGDRDSNHTVNTLLTMIERFDGMLIAATNRKEALDPALWRRFGMQIEIGMPDAEATFAILKRYSDPFKFDDDLLDVLVKLTKGAPPSLLRQLMEGLKRSLILWPRTRRSIQDPVAMISAVAASVAPHPDYDPPPLWRDPGFAKHLAGKPWPPMQGAP